MLKKPPLLIYLCIRFCQKLPINWLCLRIVFVIRRTILIAYKEPFYVESGDSWFLLYPSDNLSDKRLLCTPKMLDSIEREWFEQNLPVNSQVIDVGANIGGHCLLLCSKRKDLFITAIEPDPYLMHRLKKNIELNDYKNIKVLECAVTNENKTVCLGLDEKNRGKNSVVNKQSKQPSLLEIEGRSLIDILTQEKISKPALVKMDIEGYEHDVLSGFFQSAEKEIWPMYFQLEQYRNESLNRAVNLVLEQGYKMILRSRMNIILARQ